MGRNWIVASIVAGLVMHVVSWLVAMVPNGFVESNFEVEWGAYQVVGSVLMGGVLAVVLDSRGARSPQAGAAGGVLVGVLVELGTALSGMNELDAMALAGALAVGVVVYGIAGAAACMARSAMTPE